MVGRRRGGVCPGARVTRARRRTRGSRMTAAGASLPVAAQKRRTVDGPGLPGDALVELAGRDGRQRRIGGRIVLGAGRLPRWRAAGVRAPGWCRRLAEVAEDVAHGRNAARASITTPQLDAPQEFLVLPGGSSPRELNTQLVEELCRIDVGEAFKSAANDRPYHAKRLAAGPSTLGINGLQTHQGLGRGDGGRRHRQRCGGSHDQSLRGSPCKTSQRWMWPTVASS